MSRPSQRKVVVVVGCGFAGTACIRQLARIMRHRLDIIAFDKQPALYNYPALPRLLNEPLRSGQVEVPYSKLFAGIDIDFRQQRVTEIDVNRQTVRSADGETGYDYLVIAPGSRALPLPQQNGVRVHYPKALRHLRQLGALIEGLAERARQDQTGVHRIAVVGGGLSGVEFAMAIRESADRACRTAGVARGRIGVVLCERAARLHPAGPAGLSRRLDRELTRYGIDVLVDHEILEAAHGRLLTMDGVIPADTVVCCIGSQPNLRIELTGLTWADDGLVVDAALRCAGHTTVFAIGDGMLFRQQGRARPDLRQAHRAASQGRHTARNIVRLIDGKAAKPYRPRETPIGVMLQSHRGVFSYLGRSTAGVIAGHAKRWLEVRHT